MDARKLFNSYGAVSLESPADLKLAWAAAKKELAAETAKLSPHHSNLMVASHSPRTVSLPGGGVYYIHEFRCNGYSATGCQARIRWETSFNVELRDSSRTHPQRVVYFYPYIENQVHRHLHNHTRGRKLGAVAGGRFERLPVVHYIVQHELELRVAVNPNEPWKVAL